MEQKKSIWIKLFYFITIFYVITWTISLNLMVDESFTLGLIKHKWIEVIKLDAMDVHPPLYYLVLKLFLTLTTFWTSSMIIKAIFARIFSVICFAIMSKGIQLIFKKSLNKNINFKLIFLGLLLLPNVLYHATCIRMYAFGAMLITWELFCLINYKQQNKTSFLIYALIFAELAAYTHYFAAIIGGLLLVYEFLSTIKYKQFYSTIKLGITGITLLIFFIPWGMVASKQVSSVSHHYWMKNSFNNFVDLFYYHNFPIKIFFYCGFIILSILSIFCYRISSNSFKIIYRRILFSFYGAMFIGIITSILIRPIFQSRYLFFIFPLYLVFTIYQLFSQQKIVKIINLLSITFLSFGIFFNFYQGIRYIKCNYMTFNYIYNNKYIPNKNIKPPLNEDTSLTIEYSLYLPNKNLIVISHKKELLYTVQTGNTLNDKKLFQKLYPNIKFKNQ